MPDVVGKGFTFDLDEGGLNARIGNLEGPLGKALKKLVAKTARNAKRNCPVDTGRLRSSIVSRVEKDFDDGLVGIVGTDVEYAPYVEFGTSSMPPNSFLRAGFEEALRTIDFTDAGGAE